MNDVKEVLVADLDGGASVAVLDVESGIAHAGAVGGETPNGNMRVVLGNTVALYAEGEHLFLQIGGRRWDLADPATVISYGHDLNRKTTTLQVGDLRLEYPAWWRDDPAYDPFIPELDEDEDYLAYVYSVAQQPALQENLIKVWSAAATA
jgi:hypothetical protein